ncbi:TolC family protein [Sphingomonas carotinifaciens]|uniref:Outer membrane protein, adhesin transport system n=2 Tax=Sphingomonas carotinifaciens TaxID=1166323 RepID=A0A1G7QD07_9SPHN|nr:TolC family protein [Sphingomonas carotinifaciens]MBB4087743.1 adhesin transport system outer membrane protein [Sphingomonas carotinifaciens]SDF96358.1 outer membrane protein, adhesin transport system [Sphingomonas carotinifaciens]
MLPILLSPLWIMPAEARTLAEAVRMGLAISPEVKAARASEAAAETDVRIAKSGYLPSVSVSGGPQSFDLDGLGYEVTAAQALHDWGRVRSSVDRAKAQQGRLGEQALVRRDEIALDIAEAYCDILVTERQVANVEAFIAALSGIEAMTAARFEGHFADRSEPERVRLELARAREQLAIEQGTLVDARNRYRLLVGEEAADLAEPRPMAFTEHIAAKDLGELIADSPLYRSAVADTRTAEADLRGAKAQLLPQINAEATTLRRPIGGIARSDTIVGIRFRMSTMQGFSAFLRPQGEAQRVQAAILNQGAVDRQQRREVRTLIDNAAMMAAREQALQTQVGTADAVGQTYLDQFTVGRRDLIDILNTRREQFEAQRQLTNIHIDRLRVQFRAAARLGLIGPLIEGGLS